MSQPLPAIRAAEDLLLLAWNTSDEDIAEALKKLGTAEGTYGLLWGLGNLRTSGMDLDLYMLKKKAVLFLQELRAHRDFNTVAAVFVGRSREA